jgi:hypothetical protein
MRSENQQYEVWLQGITRNFASNQPQIAENAQLLVAKLNQKLFSNESQANTEQIRNEKRPSRIILKFSISFFGKNSRDSKIKGLFHRFLKLIFRSWQYLRRPKLPWRLLKYSVEHRDIANVILNSRHPKKASPEAWNKIMDH